ncbi:MAG: hypothetical protein HQK78_18600 [Desulfobacterales bacterium]|nr:hypothetical protein [Desulfobacterales bacterium]
MDFIHWWFEKHYVWSTIFTPLLTIIWCCYKKLFIRGIIAVGFLIVSYFSKDLLELFIYLNTKKVRYEEVFRPYWVHIIPKWKILLKEFNFDQEKIEHIVKTQSEGILFTVLESQPKDLPKLIFLNQKKKFYSKINFYKTYNEISLPYKKGTIHPTFYIEDNCGYLEISIKRGNEDPLSYSNPFDITNNTTMIAKIPFSAFGYTYNLYSYEEFDRDGEFKKYGWNRIVDDFPYWELRDLDKVCFEYEHEFLTLYFSSI